MHSLGGATPTGRRLLIYGCGTRGDVQPQIAFALGMKKAGHTVKLVANANHVDFISSMGVDTGVAGADVMEEIQNEPCLKEYLKTGTTAAQVKSFQQYMKRLKEVFPETLAQEVQHFKDFRPDVVFASPLNSYEIAAIACNFSVPVIYLGLVVGIPPSRDLYLNQLGKSPYCPWVGIVTYAAKEFVKMEMGAKKDEILKQLPESERFVAQDFHEAWLLAHHPITPSFCGFSPSLLKVPSDWTADIKRRFVLSGFWTVSKEEQEANSKGGNSFFGGGEHAKLEEFLAGGEKPVYMGWGSMMPNTAEYMTSFAVRALKISGRRGIILGGYGGLNVECLKGHKDSQELLDYAAVNVLFMKTAPHEYLFPKCSAIVHHGGIGTTAAAVRSGVPSVVPWVAWDQEDNAAMLQVKGLGVQLKQFNSNTPEALAEAIQRCLTDETLISKAKQMGEQVRAEDGVAPCVEVLDRFFREEVDTGVWKANLDDLFAEVAEIRNTKLCCSGPRWFCCWYCDPASGLRKPQK